MKMEITIGEALREFPTIRPEILFSIYHYVEDGCPTGGFLRAVLSNDLKESFGRADDGNRENMFHIVGFLYNCAPSNCWGSPEIVEEWLSNNANKN